MECINERILADEDAATQKAHGSKCDLVLCLLTHCDISGDSFLVLTAPGVPTNNLGSR